MSNILDRIEAKGRAIGREIGRAEVNAEIINMLQRIAHALYIRGFSVKEIATVIEEDETTVAGWIENQKMG